MRDKDAILLEASYDTVKKLPIQDSENRSSIYKTLKDKIDSLDYMMKQIDDFIEEHRELYNDGSYDEPHVEKILAKITANMDHVTDYLGHVYRDIHALKTNHTNRSIQNRSRNPNI